MGPTIGFAMLVFWPFTMPTSYTQGRDQRTSCHAAVCLSEGRGQNNQQPTPNDNKSEWWSSSAVLVYDLHRGMCCKPSGKMQEGREGLLMGNICDW